MADHCGDLARFTERDLACGRLVENKLGGAIEIVESAERHQSDLRGQILRARNDVAGQHSEHLGVLACRIDSQRHDCWRMVLKYLLGLFDLFVGTALWASATDLVTGLERAASGHRHTPQSERPSTATRFQVRCWLWSVRSRGVAGNRSSPRCILWLFMYPLPFQNRF